ncbi:MAG TPA: hypothetical protein VEW67_09645 [Thermoleophilaceae bacterium]|nr:hypothetical protein [Thermoleophilaceae bacterium]
MASSQFNSTTADAPRPAKPWRRSVGMALLAAVVGTLLAAPSGALAAPDLEVTLKGSNYEIQMLEEYRSLTGSYRLRFGDGGPGVGETTDIPIGASAAVVQNALNAITNISQGGGSVSVDREGAAPTNPASNYRIDFDGGPLAGTDVPPLTVVAGLIESPFPDPVRVRSVQRSEMRRDDERIEYVATVRNAALAGPPVVGDTLTCDHREPNWLPAVVTGFHPTVTVRWLRNGQLIAGATATTYTLTAADAGTSIQCEATGTNVNGVTRIASQPPAFVTPQPSPLPPAPTNPLAADSRPAIAAGATTVGTTRTCNAPVAWERVTAPYQFQWLRNGEPIPEADGTTASHTIVADDQGKVLQCQVIGSNASGATLGISNPLPVGVTGTPNLTAAQTPRFPDQSATSGPVTLEIELPEGQDAAVISIYEPSNPGTPPAGWACSSTFATATVPAKATCARSDALAPGQQFPGVEVGMALSGDTPDLAQVRATVTGGGDPDGAVGTDVFDYSLPSLGFGLIPESMQTNLFDGDSAEDTRAGRHPWAAGAQIQTTHRRWRGVGGQSDQHYFRVGLIEHTKQLLTDTPPGLVGNPLATQVLCDDPKRTLVLPPAPGGCPPESLVGQLRVHGNGAGGSAGPGWLTGLLYAIEPERGEIAQFVFGESNTKGIYVLNARLRPEDGYAVSIDSAPLSEGVKADGFGATVCSYGANISSDELHFAGCKQPGDPGAFEKPLFTNPTACPSEPLQTRMSADSWEHPGVFSSVAIDEPSMTGCELVPFTPTVSMSPTSEVANAPAGLRAEISIPSDGLEDPEGISQSHLKKTVVELPAGVSVNPSAATGLEGCSDEQLGLKTDSEPQCPDGSKLGTVEATTPVLEETLSGVMVLRTPKSTDPASGEMLRVALIVRNDERGILVKLPGSATADPQTGKLVATFDDNPQLPIATVDLELKGGSRGVLAMPQDCGDVSTKATLSPWSGNADAVSDTPSQVDEGCGNGFAPKLSAGNSNGQGRGQGGTYSVRFSREDGEQWLSGLTADLPKGLLASIKNVPLCSNSDANAGSCPAASKIGVADAKAGAGDPFVLEEKGEVFLTEGYKGGEYGLAVKIRGVAGPFRGDMELSPIVVRQAIHVDRTTAQVKAVSDPFPLIHHGVPLRVREVTVLVNRNGFMVNPSDCDPKQTNVRLLSSEGATADLSDPFRVSGCSSLAFKPKLALALTGRKQVTTGKHPGIKATVTQQGASEAGIEQAVVRLPKSLALDPENAQALCEFADGTKPDLENRCPKGSIVGRARAKTPLLKDDLVGNVYFVKNIRKDPVTGNEIRTLPMIVVALRGEIAINLKGESSTTKSGKLVNTFASVPDAPISRFNLNINGGKTGIIAVTRTRRAKINLCTGRHIAENDMDGHNGRQHDTDVRMKTPCTKKQTKAAKRHAKRAAAKGNR